MIINGTNRRINGSDVITRNHLREMVEERNMTVVKLLFRIENTENKQSVCTCIWIHFSRTENMKNRNIYILHVYYIYSKKTRSISKILTRKS